MPSAKQIDPEEIEPGMVVETTQGDLGEQDISTPKVKDVTRTDDGHVEKVVIEKGVVFKKDIEVSPDRIKAVEEPEEEGTPGKVRIAARESEIEALRAAGPDTLEEGKELAGDDDDSFLGEVEEQVPTVEGLRRTEEEAEQHRRDELAGIEDSAGTGDENRQVQPRLRFSWRHLGPGLLAGMAGNDATAVTAYAVNGAVTGYGQLWLLLLATPLYQAVQYACAKIGRISQRGLADLIREQYGRRLAVSLSLLLLVGNLVLIAGDLIAIGSGLELMTGLHWFWFVIPVAAALWYLTVYRSFGMIKKIFLVMSFAFAAYLISGFFSGANWSSVIRSTIVPSINFDFVGISSLVALLGATLSPYSMFWQAQGEKEEDRPGTPQQQVRLAAMDIGAGTLSGNLIAYFIIVCTSATLFAQHRQIQTAADAARALAPLAGPFATQLFAIGLIGAGLVAIPVLLASTSYALADTLGWPASLWKKPWQNEGFYLILTVALIISVALALIGFNPIQFIFLANVLQGVLAPILIVFIMALGNSRKVMRIYRLGMPTNVFLALGAVVTLAGIGLLCYVLLVGG